VNGHQIAANIAYPEIIALSRAPNGLFTSPQQLRGLRNGVGCKMFAQPFILVLCPPPVFIANLQASLQDESPAGLSRTSTASLQTPHKLIKFLAR
jgi:hypothetical protein